jgi:hypothetical protein
MSIFQTKRILSNVNAILIFLLVLSSDAFAKQVIGWVENVQVTPGDVVIKAKIDTGADSSSLHCDCLTTYERDGERWARFSITDVDEKTVSVEKKIIRRVKIKRHFGDEQVRDVVRMGVCIGDRYQETDVSLIDRSGLNYSMLIGRKFLKGKFIVDPSQTFMLKPHCEKVEDKSE